MAVIRYNEEYKPLAQKLRKEMTRQEKRLWYDFLRDFPLQTRRQKQIGEYIVDFFIAKARLVVELDGSQHYEDDGKAYDERRDAYLRGQGMKVLRFSNLDVDGNFEGVCATIAREAGIAQEDLSLRMADPR